MFSENEKEEDASYKGHSAIPTVNTRPTQRWIQRHLEIPRRIHNTWSRRGVGGRKGRRDEVWDRETMFSQLAKRSQSGHPGWWSADNCSIFPTVNIFRLFRSKKLTGRGNQQMLKELKKIISCIFVCLAYRICLSVLKLRGKPCWILTNTNALDRFIGYTVFAG